ncbi:hypothetical protein [Chromohalobacter sp. 296-RDG]|uniref:hypothetical protein n=1 Tax=Chromohalobacter sp. 296-RDG TaxID=2994062 RepID=UPI002468CDB4|nr:hypothetical protein [Chromohalobacter sp. 296-RDG]
MTLWHKLPWTSRQGSAPKAESEGTDEPSSANFFEAKEPTGDEEQEESWVSEDSADEDAAATRSLQSESQEELGRDKLARHTQGTRQVETVITRTKQASKLLLVLSIIGAVIIFIIGLLSLPQVREIINFIPLFNLSETIADSTHWTTYLLLFIPTTLMAALSITLWVTGLRFSAQIYGGVSNEEEDSNENANNNDAMTECVRTLGEVAKQSNGG